jgi:hypothetical protein
LLDSISFIRRKISHNCTIAMGKVIALIVISLGAMVNAEDRVADILSERAAKQIGYLDADLDTDLEHATLAKGKKSGGGAAPAPKKMAQKSIYVQAPGRPDGLDPRKNYDLRDPVTGRKVFGGTTKLLSGVGKPATEAKISLNGWWGGNNDESQATITGTRKGGKRRAFSDSTAPTGAFAAPAARFKAPVPPVARAFSAGGRPFMLAELSKGTPLSNVTFVVAAMSMLSLAVFLLSRSSSTTDQKQYFSFA